MAERDSKQPAPTSRYRLERQIGRGGMGEVFRAIAVGAGGFEKAVVVKRILPALGGDDQLSNMFIEEARLMSQLSHPNIVQVMDFGQGETDDYFLVMELVEGVDLSRLIAAFNRRNERIPVAIALHVVGQMLRGLGHAHRKVFADGRTLVHRDISPGNVLLSVVGEVKLADFGVALVTHDQAGPQGSYAGKPGYMAPEQARGEPVDARADLFAVGVVLFLLLTGKQPFLDERGEPSDDFAPSLALLREKECAALEAFVVRALAPSVEERFSDARDMMRQLAELAEAGGHRATADDLADLVQGVVDEEESTERRVVELNGQGPAELTRHQGSGVFTMRMAETEMSNYSSIKTRPFESASPSSGPQVGSPRKWIFATLGVVLLFFAYRAVNQLAESQELRSAEGVQGEASSEPLVDVSASVRVKPPESAPTSLNHEVETAPSVRREMVAPGPKSPNQPSRSQASERAALSASIPSPPAPGSAAASASLAPAAPCVGDVLLSSKGSFSVRGGPATVQTPGSYRWPCGTYQLVGRSRKDGHERSVSVVVNESRRARARFE